MSEIEKKERARYQKNRKMLIRVQTAFLAVLLLATLITTSLYVTNSKSAYVSYTEEGSVIYRAYLADNDFYAEEYLNGSHAYIAALIDRMTADFSYDLDMQIDNVSYQYSCVIDARLLIKDKSSKTKIYDSFHEVLFAETAKGSGERLSIRQLVEFDYQKYDQLATDFNNAYDLKNTENTLLVTMNINVIGMSESFAESNQDTYTVSLSLPLMQSVVSPTVSATVPTGEQRITVKDVTSYGGLRVAAIVLGCVDVLAALALVLYIFLSIDKHIDYARKVKKLLSGYESYIQRILNPFDFSGYQVLSVSCFKGLLEIRDTIKAPILMYENEDQTCAQFFIAATANVLYLYEVKVEGNHAETLGGDEAPLFEEPDETVPEETVPEKIEATLLPEEPYQAPAVEETTAEEAVAEEVTTDETAAMAPVDEKVVYVTYKRSYYSRLVQSEDALKEKYITIKEELLSYKKVKARISWGAETLSIGRLKLAKFTVHGKSLWLNLRSFPEDFTPGKYSIVDCSGKKKFEEVPVGVKIKSDRSMKLALRLVDDMMRRLEIPKSGKAQEKLSLPFEDTATLIEKGYIKENYSGKRDGNTSVVKIDVNELLKKPPEEET